VTDLNPGMERDLHRFAQRFKSGNNIQEFAGDARLPLFPKQGLQVILKFQDIFFRRLHGHEACRVFTGQGLGKGPVKGMNRYCRKRTANMVSREDPSMGRQRLGQGFDPRASAQDASRGRIF
jgi:hypothetical protein